jgi:dolichol-phosphate mannosyltransferase
VTADHALPATGAASVWVVVPTYNERDNVEALAVAVLRACPQATLLIVDDGSPDGTGEIADRLAADDRRLAVLHRSAKEGLGPAYRAGIRYALDRGADIVVQMDCDFSHDPAALPALIAPLSEGYDLALGTRYMPGGGTENWGLGRRIISRGGTLTARAVLGLSYRDLTGGFKAWSARLLERVDVGATQASGYGFQIEATWNAHLCGARIAEVPITFRERVAGSSKMTNTIVAEAMLMLFRLRFGSAAAETVGDLAQELPVPQRSGSS